MRFVKIRNGNYIKAIDLKTGTLIKYNKEDSLIPEYPDSMDVKITNKCDKGCKFCLFPSTKLIKEGEIKVEIKDVKINDHILSFNHLTNIPEFKKVLTKFERDYEGEIFEIETVNGEKIYCTPNHKLFTQRGYIRADELKDSDLIYTL